MNEIKDFKEVISFKSLYDANKKCLRGKRNKREAIEYQNELGKNLTSLHYRLKYGKYNIERYHCFMIYDPKEREIQAISYEDRIVQRAICDNYLVPLLDRYLFYYNVACRKNKGSSLVYKYLKEGLGSMFRKYGLNFYVVKGDMKKYFDSIDHDILKEKLRRIVKDKNMMVLLERIIDSYHPDTNLGLPMGNQSSQCFALLYLNDLDHLIKEWLHVKYYIRYMDDMVLLVEGKETAKKILDVIGKEINKCNLSINPKSQIIKISKGFEFIGRVFYLTETGKTLIRIKKQSKKRMIAHIKNTDSEDIKQTIVSYNGIFTYVDNYHFFNRLMSLKKK